MNHLTQSVCQQLETAIVDAVDEIKTLKDQELDDLMHSTEHDMAETKGSAHYANYIVHHACQFERERRQSK